MGAQLRAVRRRIRTVQSTAKITRAQELIASSRVLKAQQRVRDATPYARELVRALEAVVSRSSSVDHPLVNEAPEPSRAAVLIMTIPIVILYLFLQRYIMSGLTQGSLKG